MKYCLALYFFSLALLYSVTMTTPNLVGTDIHLEYYFAQEAYLHGWNPGLAYLDNSALSLTILAPVLARLLHLDVLWVLKAIFPALFALVPVILFLIYRQWIGNVKALLAEALFVSIPTFFIEITAVARQQIGEIFLALIFYVVLATKWRVAIKLPVVVILGGLVIVSHYSLGPILIGYLGMAVVAMLVLRIDIGFPKWAMATALTASVVMAVGYYGTVAGGMPLRYMTACIPVETQTIGPFTIGPLISTEPFASTRYPPGIAPPPAEWRATTPGGGAGGPDSPEPAPTQNFSILGFENHDTMMQAALGMDFMQSSAWGKAFRFIQILTEAMLLVGVWLLRKFKPFWVFGSGACALLAFCVLIPGFSAILNATRFYHVALFALAPAFAFGCWRILRGYKWAAFAFIAVYLFFTSGLAFEAAGVNQVKRIDVPYHPVLSNYRVDLNGSYTDNDARIRAYVQGNNVIPIFTDLYGVLWLQEKLGVSDIYNLPANTELPIGSHVYLRDRGQAITWSGIGLREIMGTYSLEAKSVVVYQAGNAKLLKVVKE